ncbi:MAG: sigma-70 family RNA polymerase sigma factor [Sedimentisphaerales bacterium]|nr:sigma-70 family RNA polymerase sigma factor [Sedimentisphaerales bacterium]
MKDRRLIYRLSHADPDALRLIYNRYKNDLLTVAMALLADPYAAEDCIHDVFVHFAEEPTDMRARRNLRGYLMRCVANRAKNLMKRQNLESDCQKDEQEYTSEKDCTESRIIVSEESMRIFDAMAKLPAEQREVVSLHIHGRMKFREIAKQLDISINTVQSRYRYGIEKLRTLL